MAPRKRKADAALPAEASDGLPCKRARSESTADTFKDQEGNLRSSKETFDDSTEHSILAAESMKQSPTALSNGNKNENMDVPPTDLPQRWDEANAADKKLMNMKEGTKLAWTRIEQLWERETGERLAKGVLRGRYKHLKDIMARSNGTAGTKAHVEAVEEPFQSLENTCTLPTNDAKIPSPASSKFSKRSSGAHATSRRAKPTLRAPTKRKVGAESEDESLDEDLDQDSNQDLDDLPKHSSDSAGRRTRSAVDELARPNAPDALSDGPAAKRRKTTTAKPSDGTAEVESSNELDETSKRSRGVAKSAKGPRARSAAVAASSELHDTAQTADEMLVEMKEKGSSWVEISQAWTEKTGLTHAPETLRKRYPRIKDGSASKLCSITSTSSKRNAKGAPIDEVSHESSRKRSKVTVETPHEAETPIKRNMDRGKRKNFVKYTESTTDEDELYAAPIEPAVDTSAPAKPRAGRAAKVNRSDPEWLVTNEKSPLVSEDLHAEFSDPKTYENFTQSDWEDLRETLPPNVPVNPDGYSIPMTFFKYDPDFRRGIREFQEDLGSGRLDPKWQAEAAEAMEARARGDFDAYKEDQFEAFWGQKQKMNHAALAGESTKIKLDLLIQNEIFKIGDYFSYSRAIGGRKNGILVEKDCKIVSADGKALTLAIPPGRRKYSRLMFESEASVNTGTEGKATIAETDGQRLKDRNSSTGAADTSTDRPTDDDGASEINGKRDGALNIDSVAENDNLVEGSKVKDPDLVQVDKTDEVDAAAAGNTEDIVPAKNDDLPKNPANGSTTSEVKISDEAADKTSVGQSSIPASRDEHEDILHSVSSLNQLEQKIVEIDGRMNPKGLPVQNTWKNFRGIRNNQDLGSLFEMREDFYVDKHPKIVKEPKRKR